MAEHAKPTDWGDLELEGIGWVEAGRDLVLRLREPALNRCRSVTLRWAEALQFRLALADGHGGRPLTWSGDVVPLPDGRYSFQLDFASTGDIRLVCAEIDIRVVE